MDGAQRCLKKVPLSLSLFSLLFPPFSPSRIHSFKESLGGKKKGGSGRRDSTSPLYLLRSYQMMSAARSSRTATAAEALS